MSKESENRALRDYLDIKKIEGEGNIEVAMGSIALVVGQYHTALKHQGLPIELVHTLTLQFQASYLEHMFSLTEGH